MKKLIFVFAAFIGLMLTTQSYAQEKVISVGLELAVPMGDFGKVANLGFGASGEFEAGLTGNIALNLNAGALFYATEFDGYSLIHVPIQAGARYYLQEQQEGLFLGVKAGVHVGIATMDEISIGGVVVSEKQSDSDAAFSFAPEVGYFITSNISLGLRYQIISGKDGGKASSYLGVRAALNF